MVKLVARDQRPRERSKTGPKSGYRPEFCKKLISYFSDPESWRLHLTEKGTAQIIPKDKLPTFGRFAMSIGFDHDTILSWRDKYPEWDKAYAICKELQKDFFIQGATAGSINAGFAIFMLKCNHGMAEPESGNKGDLAGAIAQLISELPS